MPKRIRDADCKFSEHADLEEIPPTIDPDIKGKGKSPKNAARRTDLGKKAIGPIVRKNSRSTESLISLAELGGRMSALAWRTYGSH